MEKKLVVVLGMAALVVMALSLTAVVSTDGGKEKNRLLVVDIVRTFGVNGGLGAEKTSRIYTEGDIYAEGQVGQAQTGKFMSSRVKTEPEGALGSFGHVAFRIFGQGDIHIALISERIDQQLRAEGAIIGGTGRFKGLSGQSSATLISQGVARVTFSFEKNLPKQRGDD